MGITDNLQQKTLRKLYYQATSAFFTQLSERQFFYNKRLKQLFEKL
jgi:hypothetical protein